MFTSIHAVGAHSPSSPIVLHRLSPDAAKPYAELHRRSLTTDPDSFALTLAEEEAAGCEIRARAYLQANHVIGAFDAHGLLGAVALCPLPGRLSHMGELSRFYVEPSQRGKGVADKLLGAFMKAADAMGIKGCKLSVASSNERALSFYLKHGFEEYGRLPGEFMSTRGPVTGLHMYRAVDPLVL